MKTTTLTILTLVFSAGEIIAQAPVAKPATTSAAPAVQQVKKTGHDTVKTIQASPDQKA
jgi:hypothetical protein